jgi:uncharacterized protein (TIGR02996 family)
MDSPQAPFLNTIVAAPDDDAPRLIYADWLDENGDPERAEFIRKQIEILKIPHEDPRRKVIESRIDHLSQQHRQRWLEQYCPEVSVSCLFDRGFVAKVTMTGRDFHDAAPTFFASEPVQDLVIRKGKTESTEEANTTLTKILSSQYLKKLKRLVINDYYLPEHSHCLAEHIQQWTNMRCLILVNNAINASDLREALQAGSTSLQELHLPKQLIGFGFAPGQETEAIGQLASAQNFPNLRLLNLRANTNLNYQQFFVLEDHRKRGLSIKVSESIGATAEERRLLEIPNDTEKPF